MALPGDARQTSDVGGPTDKTTVVRFVGSPVCVVKSYSVDRFQLTLFAGNMALLTYDAMQDTTCAGRPVPSPVLVASLYIKRGDRWLNAAYQQTQTRDQARLLRIRRFVGWCAKSELLKYRPAITAPA